jgi:thymidylate synthase ThyX
MRECGAEGDWHAVMAASRVLYEELRDAGYASVAPYAVSMAYRLRFNMQMNAREAMHVIELRTSDQAHPNYRRICLEMLRLIREQAGHRRIAGAMMFAGTSEPRLERLAAERRNEAKRLGGGAAS